jgi:Tetratricopeptide repeat
VNLASDLSARGEHRAAYELDYETLTRSRRALGAEHPSTLACALNMSFDLSALDRAEEGSRVFEETLDGYRRVLGDDHPVIVAAHAGSRANCDVDPMPL